MEEGSARRRDLDLTTHNTRKRKTSMPSVGFEPPVSANEDPQNLALHCLQVYVYIHMYMYMYICIYIHKYMYIYIDTHTDTHKRMGYENP